MIQQSQITLPPFKRGFHLITDVIIQQLHNLPENGMINIFLQHTSAAITINENFNHSVRNDFESFFKRLIPDGSQYFEHNSEGDDDMPAHLKASLLGQSVIIPITNKKINLGIWQGIYFCEFRNNGGKRKLVLTVFS